MNMLLNTSDKRQANRGTKSLRAKDRITLVLCVSATGSRKVPPLLICTAKQPHCFRTERSPVPYINQSSAWMDRKIYTHWWNEVFVPAVRQWTKKPVALIMDCCSGHDLTLKDPTGQIALYFLPPNTTSIYQPLDQGIISSVKKDYRQRLLAKVVASVDRFEELQPRRTTYIHWISMGYPKKICGYPKIYYLVVGGIS